MVIFIEESILKIIIWCLRIIDQLKAFIDGIFSNKDIFTNGENVNLITSFLENSSIKYIFWVIFILSIGIICVCTIISLVKNMIVNNQTIMSIIGKFMISIISMLIILAFFIISILVVNELTNLVCNFLYEENNFILSNEVFNLLVGKWNNGYSIMNFDINSITTNELLGEYNGFINNIWPTGFTNNGMIDYSSFNYILGLISSILLFMSFMLVIFILIKRIFKIAFLYLVLPLSASTISLDDGKRLNRWKEELIEELISFFLIFLGYNIISIMLPFILNLNFINLELTKILKLFLITIGYLVIPNYKKIFRIKESKNDMKTNVINYNSSSNLTNIETEHRYVDAKL